eukprot:CAMPEP_0204219834 /NCGR_PEP_ID=MMETSP0361-20130328/80570_1 /ASSEMBLY_ACC=CAM_ASM_000343 /TAXON_ID=268821 /ORGANISM="Scrippsiella Hangoei, Strain SHTV-5" /LENGTH=55 /DNA_ID=CAMNT_0051185167 /DNA_START=58 /DNA_END=225 /DNA_ORIENTATION=-
MLPPATPTADARLRLHAPLQDGACACVPMKGNNVRRTVYRHHVPSPPRVPGEPWG